MSCLDEDTLLRFAQAQVGDDERARIEAHLDRCDDCRTAAAEAARALFEREEQAAASPEPLPPGTRISRYEILGVIGMGGAGVVYRAFDPELERPIALKLIRPDASASGSRGNAGARLQREARAMAQLSHPNVVNVFDSGIYEGDVFVVMELVDGTTLGEWLRAEARSWDQALEVMLEAGRGLAAAHAAGLVHRDFKPDNVLIGADGRARVTDFGLARTPGAGQRPPDDDAAAPEITRFAGTPAFMAPEQLLARETDARSDQFSFCVTLYLALYGEHPFGVRPRRGEPLARIAEPVVAGRLQPSPAGSAVPDSLRRVLVRGLSGEPAQRYPSLPALLAELARFRREAARLRRNVRIALAAAAASVVAAALVLSSARGREWASRVASRCGNGVLEPGEQCDDGNASDGDGCVAGCRFAACGDGKLRAGVEQCDDGNSAEGDGCSASCLRCRSGDASFSWPESGHCYSRHDVQVSWFEARRICARAGGDLAALTSSYELLAVHDALLGDGPRRPWIGFHDAQGDGHFAWVTGESTASGIPPLHLKEEPPGPRRCAILAPGRLVSSDFHPLHLEAPDCAGEAPVVCEQPQWLRNPKDNHAYLVVSQPLPWSAARADCTARGGHLATIKDADDETFITARTLLGAWLGASDAEVEGDFRWVTGEPFAYRAFVAGEPDDRDGRADCLVLGLDKGWHDRICDEPNAYVCEID